MYAIVDIVYGFQLTGETLSEDLEEAFDEELNGFEKPYSGGGDDPRAFGVVLDSFEEGHDDISSLRMEENDDDRAKLKKYLDALPDHLVQEIESFGPPRVFFLWGTS